jgi:hypothetical protein
MDIELTPRFHRRYSQIPYSLSRQSYEHQPQVCIGAKAWLCLPAAADNLNETLVSFASLAAMDIESYEHQPQVCIGAKAWLCLPAAANNLNETSISFAAAMDLELRTTIPLAVSSNTPFADSAILSVEAAGPSTTFLVGSAWTPETALGTVLKS